MQIFVKPPCGSTVVLDVVPHASVLQVKHEIQRRTGGVPAAEQRLVCCGRLLQDACTLAQCGVGQESTVHVALVLRGGIDFQNRAGSKFGGGGIRSASDAAVDRKEQLRKLAMETIDLSKDPYFMRNHLGYFECKLCLTLHNTEGNYLAHTQGKRHQQNLGRRAAREARLAGDVSMLPATRTAPKQVVKIGRPGYKVVKQRDPETGQRSLLFELAYPEVATGVQPRHRFMSAFEQRVEAPDKNYQYILFACEPYETIAFKIPNLEVDKGEGKFFSNWDRQSHTFTLQLYFKAPGAAPDQAR